MENKTRGYEEILKSVVRKLEKERINYMIVGGIAANYYGLPRPTFDIDIAINISVEDTNKIVKVFKSLGFQICSKEVKKILQIGNMFVVSVPQSIYRVDVWIPRSGFEKMAFKRRRKERFSGEDFFLISPEDLIIFKLRDKRIRDYEDVLGILKRQKSRLDESYLNSEAKILGIFKELEKIRKEV